MKRIALFALVAALVVAFAVPASPAVSGPKDLVKGTVDKVLDILKNKELKKPGKTKERRDRMRAVVSQRFDFEEMARRSLAIHWQKRSPAERQEFVPIFSDLLERSYVNKIESYTDEKIVYDEEKIEGEYATVRTRIITKRNVEVPVVYKLMRKSDNWLVYDVIIEEVSLVNNYRSQFNKIITKQSYGELVKRMKSKQAEEAFSEDL